MKNQKIEMIDNKLYVDEDIYEAYVMTNKIVFDTNTPIDDIDAYVDALVAEIENEEQNKKEIDKCVSAQNNELVIEDFLVIAA